MDKNNKMIEELVEQVTEINDKMDEILKKYNYDKNYSSNYLAANKLNSMFDENEVGKVIATICDKEDWDNFKENNIDSDLSKILYHNIHLGNIIKIKGDYYNKNDITDEFKNKAGSFVVVGFKDDGLMLIKQIILLSHAKNILEIGTAIGYSAIFIKT